MRIDAAIDAGEYVDAGAECTDFTDGDVENVTTTVYKQDVGTGDFNEVEKVDVTKPGTYNVKYTCVDEGGNSVDLVRMVDVHDTQCPVITLRGSNVISVEAGNDYEDPGYDALDNLDGDISPQVRVTGDTVDTSKVYTAMRSCHEIRSEIDTIRANDPNSHLQEPSSGYYWITTRAEGVYQTLKVLCDMHSDDGFGFTYLAVKDGKRVRPYDPTETAENSCGEYGLKMATFRNGKQRFGAQFFFDEAFFVDAPATSDEYLCSTNDHSGEALEDMSDVPHWALTDSEEGVYIVKYQVSDSYGNSQCETKYRTVLVKDTLSPVVTLHLNNTLIQAGHGGYSTIDGAVNPANTDANPWMVNLMAETSTDYASVGVYGFVAAALGIAFLAHRAQSVGKTLDIPV